MNNLIFVKNYAEWIKPEWVEYMQAERGMGYPGDKGQPENALEEAVWKEQTAKGYDMSKCYWYVFFDENMPFEIPPPIKFENDMWLFNKVMPGDVIPMHVDQDMHEGVTVTRYWMALQDYEDGHGFIVDGELITDYKKGDLFKFKDPAALHGSFNIGWTPRFTYNWVVFD